ncbi:thiol:disulfide interchange protein DsbA/DsbL [Vibrio maerlii]|uniref:thiol:disulfide interchange protein DsbA/DsbL n=1 Tax=Vibrio maerlii TaxID=2231648 RepID=UPI000E3E9B21|nr:thiol:disulfide interchange protein DsbA/DsbL [Vibrio maerlii]
MFKKILAPLMAILTALVLAGCGDNTPKEGTHYKKVPVDLSEYNMSPITEVFSLTCGHCRSMEKVIPELETLTGESIDKLHVTFNKNAHIAAMIYYTAVMQLDGKPTPEMMEELFAAIQMQQDDTSITTQQEMISNVFDAAGLTNPYKIDTEMQEELFKMVDQAKEISTRAQINAVPTFVINGKYEIITSGHTDVASMAETMTFLLNK